MWRCLTLDQTWQATRITFKYCIPYACVLFCRFLSNYPFIAYFLKKKYSLRQNILKKNWGFERGHSHQSQLVFIWVLLKLGLDWEQAARRTLKNCWKRVTGRWIGLYSPTSGQFTGGEPLLRRSDRTLKQFFPYIRSDDVPTSGQAKKI